MYFISNENYFEKVMIDTYFLYCVFNPKVFSPVNEIFSNSYFNRGIHTVILKMNDVLVFKTPKFSHRVAYRNNCLN